jgi:hypothetical protein
VTPGRNRPSGVTYSVTWAGFGLSDDEALAGALEGVVAKGFTAAPGACRLEDVLPRLYAHESDARGVCRYCQHGDEACVCE